MIKSKNDAHVAICREHFAAKVDGYCPIEGCQFAKPVHNICPECYAELEDAYHCPHCNQRGI